MEFVLGDVVRVMGAEGATEGAGMTAERLGSLYGQMLAARRLDERVAELREQGRVAEHVIAHGEEAVTVGAAAALEPTDWLIPAGRDAAAVLARGVPLAKWVAHVLGVEGDPSKARQRPDRFSARQWRVVSANPRAASQLVQAAGLAWAARAQGHREAVLAFLDEAAVEAGEFHDGMNFAGVFRAPAVFVARSRSVDVARRAFAYGIAHARADGSDVLAVHRVVREALERARAGGGATLVEARLPGAPSVAPSARSSDGSPEPPPDEDPVAKMRAYLGQRGMLDEGGHERWAAEADGAITRAVEEALRVAVPPAEAMFDDVYGAAPWHLAEQRAALVARR